MKQITANNEFYQYWSAWPLVIGDVGAYAVSIRLKEPVTGTFRVSARKPTGTVQFVTAQLHDGTSASVTLNNTMYDVEGTTALYLEVFDDIGNKVTEKTIDVDVTQGAGEGNPAQDDITKLDSLIAQTTQAAAQAVIAAGTITDAVDEAIIQAGYAKTQGDYAKAQGNNLQTALDNKVDKISGKGLSTNDYTTAEKTKLAGIAANANNYVHPSTHPASIITESSTQRFFTDTERAKLAGIEAGAQVNTVTSVAGKTGAVTVTKSDVGLGSVDNTSDLSKPVSTATQTALNAKADKAELANLAGFIGYTDNDIYGVEVDFENKTFTRLAGAVGKNPGADFDAIGAFGGRYRCNLTDTGVEVAKYGEAAYSEMGVLTQPVTVGTNTYTPGHPVQTMVKQPKFYYKIVPLKLEKNEERETVNITFNAGAASGGNIKIILNGTPYDVLVNGGDSATTIADKVRNTTFPGWTTHGSSGDPAVVFAATKAGGMSAPFFMDMGTGVAAAVTRTQIGYKGKGFKLRKARYYVSMYQKEGFKVHPAFVKNDVEKDFIYLSAFEGSLFDVSALAYILNDAQVADFAVDKLSSIKNAKPVSGLTQNLTRRNCGILAENRGAGWSQQYAASAACSQLLFMIEYASMNSQTAIGRGVVDKQFGSENDAELTGATSNLGNASGMAAGTNGIVSVTYRGEENIWGNIWKFTDGMNIYCDIANNAHDLYVADHSFAESKNSDNYSNAGITLATQNGYISAMAYSESFDWLFVPAETNGDSALPVGDYLYQSAASSGYKIAYFGSVWYNGLIGGAFGWIASNSSTYHARDVGGRLVYVPV